ncbi:alpha/beta fold hydrolase [Streptomyces massasporeus]|uniref:alpha/beta hydrolase n=1 Tax=Streptomyces massasporeus TaxID=67324 RepID=UPI0033A1E38B
MTRRLEVEFPGEDGNKLAAWLYLPARPGPHPAVTMAHGFAATREHGLDRFARVFADAGFVVLVHDHRGFGGSSGVPRHDVDPWAQIADWRRAVSFLETRPEVDPERIGIWGTSYAGGHAVILGATDSRLRCVVAQVPTTSGFEQSRRRVPASAVAQLESSFCEDDRDRFRGKLPARIAVVATAPGMPAAYDDPQAVAFYTQPAAQHAWTNELTLRSSRTARMYEPSMWIARVSPTPLLMIVALQDVITNTDLQLEAYERALEPKSLVTVPGGHFAPYDAQFSVASRAAVDWFLRHLDAQGHDPRTE